MIGALATIALLAAEPTAHELGRSSVYAGFCSQIGWETNRDRVVAAGDAYAARHPDRAEADLAAEINEGIEQAQTEIAALIETFRAGGEVSVLRREIETRCDAVVRDVPEFLSRSASTAATFDAAMAGIAASNGRNPES